MTATRRIRLLFLAKDASRGGTMWELAYLLKHIDKQRFDSMVLLPRGGDLLDAYRTHARVHVFETASSKKPTVRNRGFLAVPASLAEYIDLRRVREAEQKQRQSILETVRHFAPDILILHYHFPIAIFNPIQQLGLATIRHIQLRFAHLHQMGDAELAKIVNGASWFVCEGNGVRKELHTLAGIPNDKIQVIPMPVDSEILTAQKEQPGSLTRASLGIPDNAIVVGTSAALLFEKAPDLLLKAALHLVQHFPQLPVHFIWMGGQPYMFQTVYGRSIQQLAAELGVADKIHFVGDQQNIYPFLKLLDIYAHPSRTDAFPHAVLEAMGLGIPAVTFMQGLAEEEFARDALLVAENFDPVRLAEAIACLAEQPQLRQSLGERGARVVCERLDAKKNIKAYEALLEQIAGNESMI